MAMKLRPQMAATSTASAMSRGGNMPPVSRGVRAIMQ
jgi:hypothetical protein